MDALTCAVIEILAELHGEAPHQTVGTETTSTGDDIIGHDCPAVWILVWIEYDLPRHMQCQCRATRDACPALFG